MKQKLFNYLFNKMWFVEMANQRYYNIVRDMPINIFALNCGLEDNQVTDRYEAMHYGMQKTIEQVLETIKNA